MHKLTFVLCALSVKLVLLSSLLCALTSVSFGGQAKAVVVNKVVPLFLVVVIEVYSLSYFIHSPYTINRLWAQSTSLPFLLPEDLPIFPSWRPFGLVDSIFGPIQFDFQRYVVWNF